MNKARLIERIAELVRDVMPSEYHDLAVDHAKVIMVDLGDAVLGPFSPKAHDYASKVLTDYGVELRLGTSVKEIAADHVLLSDGQTIATHCVVWGGGLMAAPLAHTSGLKQGRGGRIDVRALRGELSVPLRSASFDEWWERTAALAVLPFADEPGVLGEATGVEVERPTVRTADLGHRPQLPAAGSRKVPFSKTLTICPITWSTSWSRPTVARHSRGGTCASCSKRSRTRACGPSSWTRSWVVRATAS